MNRRIVVFVAVTALLAVGASSASAAHGTPREITHLNRLVRTLRRQRAEARAALAASQAKLAASQQQATSLSSQLQTANGQVASLQATLNAIPTPLAVAEQQVAEEVSWADGGAATPPGQLVAEAALDYTAGHVQLGAFGYLEDHGLVAPGWPTTDVNQTLSVQAGYCGHAAEVFKAIVEHFGYHVTGVWFTYTDPNGTPDGHTAVEVYYGGGWHFFDPTFDQFWTDSAGNVLPIDQIRAGQGTLQKNGVSFFNLIDATVQPWPGGDDTWFETDPSTTVAVGDQYLP